MRWSSWVLFHYAHRHKLRVFWLLLTTLSLPVAQPLARAQIARAASSPYATTSQTTSTTLHAHRLLQAPRAGQPQDRIEVLVKLEAVPVTVLYAQMRTRRYIPERIVRAAAQRHLERIEADQTVLLPLLTAPEIDAVIIGRTQRVLNGIYILVAPDKLNLVRQLPGVVAVEPLPPGSVQTGPVRPGQSGSTGTVQTGEDGGSDSGPELPSVDEGATE
jgi:hypothetical protein